MSIKTKQRRSFTLSTEVVGWINSKANEYEISRSELVDRLLGRHCQEEREKEMKEGYRVLENILKDTAQASLSLQKKVIPDY